ncbi:MAG: type II secretion system F family protein [Balneolaceae bacterium]|nr:MAG: type II secretion system F family protein [Balneolaceae bacterium]
MPQFRFRGIASTGKPVQSEFEAPTKKEAKYKVDRLINGKGIKFHALDEKQTFQYKAKKNGTAPLIGEQEAYSKDEIEKALKKVGYTEVSIQKKLFNIRLGVPQEEIVTFMRLSSDMLRQKMNFDEILDLLHDDTQNPRMKEVIRQIQKDMKDGKDGQEVYGKHEDVFGKFAAYMLGLASTSGNMGLVFENTAKFLERDAEFKKNLRRALFMPAITVLAVFGVILFYVGYIFPVTAEMFVKYNIELPPMTAATLEWSYFLQANWIPIILAFVIPLVIFVAYIKTHKGGIWFDKVLIKLPIMGDLLHKTSIEIFARVFYTLYSGSGQNVDALRVSAEACRNRYMEKRIKEVSVPMMLKDGAGIVESLEASNVFTHTALSRFKLGAESGSLRENALQLAKYYEVQTNYKMQSAIDQINLFINLFIMIALIFITVVSAESALVKPNY